MAGASSGAGGNRLAAIISTASGLRPAPRFGSAPLSVAQKTARRIPVYVSYSLANFLRTPALPEAVKHWSLTTLRDRLVKIGAKIVRHGRSIALQMAEVMVPRTLFQQILDAIAAVRPEAPRRC